MHGLLKISEAASLALHAMALVAAENGMRMTTSRMAKTMEVSEAHLSKVMQRLVKSGLVKSTRGPKGGFSLGKEEREITLLDIYRVVEGELAQRACLLQHPICKGDGCLLGKIAGLEKKMVEYLGETSLSDIRKLKMGENLHE
jgi:Rrf2 family protein